MIRPWSTWPLRVRLVVTMTVLFAAVLGAVGVASTALLRENLMANLDSKVQDTIVRANAPMGQDHFMIAPGFDQDAVGAVFDQNGAAQQSGRSNFDTRTLTTAQIAALAAVPDDGYFHDITVPNLGTYRALAQHSPGSQAGGRVVVALSMARISSTVQNLVATEAVLGVAGVILVGFVGFGLIRVSLRPLDRVAATAARISLLPLHEGEVGRLSRVPAQDTDTRTESGLVGASLNRMIDHVSAALEARHASETRVRQFVADASHELRTPLASIKGYAELTRRSRESVPPDTAYALGRVESEATRMTALVEDLLLLARLDAGRPLERAPLDLAPLVVDAVRDAHAAVPDHKWEVRLPEDAAEVLGDEHRLHQVLVNLLANAGKHTPAGTTVTASLTREGDCAVVAIADDGPGIPQELLPTVFERFARGDGSRSRKAGSTGLGLAIVAAVVSSHGGQVWVTSEPGETVFTVRLPLADAATATS
ncbi:two-component sensor histidine kinase [Streptacidiphilus pinicola]|uniref:histidine kinase n=1 Tax=Streptacidiphilus pinicola TaxID=2219663 RepID=A0A2X0J2E1_9ACTN|nr:HAMP domain-containing sensor histidine kinase [Streptacidiphilus pinicola]RAG84366.1 two-component sensor histidine kinase [Streptacidiphilus pinicola]